MVGLSVVRHVAGITALVLASSACKHGPKRSAPAVIPSVPGSASAVGELPLSPIERRSALATLYRPAPDRRFLRAFDEIERVVTGRSPAEPARARYEGGKWVIAIAGREIARLSEIPTFDEALAAATSRAEDLVKPWSVGGPVPPDAAPLPFDDQAFVTLTAAQESWTQAKSRAALHEAARALTSIAFVSFNDMDLDDGVPARALALIALDKALAAPTRSLESALAAAFGYRATAEKLAEPLPKSDPTRQYLLDEAALTAAARAHDAPAWTRYLWLRRLVSKRDRPAETAFRQAAFPDGDLRLPIVALRGERSEFANAREVAILYPAVALLETGIAARAEDALSAAKRLREKPLRDSEATAETIRSRLAATRGATLVRFDRDLPNVGSSDKGPFLEGELHRAYLRSFMYSAQLADFLFEIDTYASLPSAKAFVDALEPSPSAEAQEFKAWVQTMVAIAEGADPTPAIPRVGAASRFGFGPRARLTRVVQRRTAHDEAPAQRATRQLAPFLDTRPGVLDTFADIAWHALLDVRAGEKYWREVAAIGPQFTSARRWLAFRAKDEPALRALWADATLGADSRIDALALLERMGRVSASEADAEIDRFVAESDAWPARESAVAHLVARGRHARARAIASDWLSRNERRPGLEPMQAHVRIAESFEAERRWSEALAAVKPAIATWAFDPMAHAAVLHARLGQRSEALELAKKLLERYPSSGAVRAGAEVRWLGRDYDGAAEQLAHPPREARMRKPDWQNVGRAFVTAFAGAPEDAKKGIDSLLAKGVAVESVLSMAWGAWHKKEPELAFMLITRPPPPPNRAHHIGRLVNAYSMLRAWKGETAAADWLRPQLKPEESPTLAAMATELGEEPLLWSVASESGSPGDVEKLWTRRAASARRTKSLHAKLAEVRAHYETTPGGGGYWNVIGRYLAGLADDATVAALARDPRSSAEVAFYMGARAEGEGRYDDANDFYRCALEANVKDTPELAQARATLSRWKNSGVPLANAGEIPFPRVPDSEP